MAMSGIGKITSKAAGRAVETISDFVGTQAYPESEYALAAYLFDRILQAERDHADRSREYYIELMQVCLAAVRPKA